MTGRPAFVGGVFYPAKKDELIVKINSFLNHTAAITPKNPRIIIVPHAGYDYSGQIAAWGYRQINPRTRKVWLLGVSHRSFFKGLSLWPDGSWQTPLGMVEVDIAAINRLTKSGLGLEKQDYHLGEHTLEVQLPFLQSVLSEFTIIPMLLSFPDPVLIADLAQVLCGTISRGDLLVISTDLCHYPPFEAAKIVDKKTIGSILTGDESHFNDMVMQAEARLIRSTAPNPGLSERGNRRRSVLTLNKPRALAQGASNGLIPGLETTCCGKAAVRVGLKMAEKWGLTAALIAYGNSGDLPGADKERVVGYAAIGFYDQT